MDVTSPRVTQGLRAFIKCTKQEKFRRSKLTKEKTTPQNKYDCIKRAMVNAVDDKEGKNIEDLLRSLEAVAKDLLRKLTRLLTKV